MINDDDDDDDEGCCCRWLITAGLGVVVPCILLLMLVLCLPANDSQTGVTRQLTEVRLIFMMSMGSMTTTLYTTVGDFNL